MEASDERRRFRILPLALLQPSYREALCQVATPVSPALLEMGVSVMASKAKVLDQLKQPALLSTRVQPIRRPVLRLKRTRRTNEINELGE
jgi:hypothetical protein